MHFDRQTLIRRPARWMACGAILVSVGCAGSPLGFKKKGLASADLNPEAGIQTAEVESPKQEPACAVVTLDSLGGSNEGIQPTAGREPAKPALPNYSRIFGESKPAQQTAMADPFLNVQQPSAAVVADASGQPSAGRRPVQLSNDFDQAMAQLAGSKPAATASQPSHPFETKQNPFAQTQSATAADPNVPSQPTADELAAELAAALAKPKKTETPQAASGGNNPFAAFVNNANVSTTQPAQVQLENLAKAADDASEQVAAAAEQTAADWVKEAAASLPAPSGSAPLNAAAEDRLTTASTPAENVVQSAARARIRQLLDSSELALRAGRYNDAQRIAEQAFQIETTESVRFGPRDRTPSSILFRIASAKQLAGEAIETSSVAANEPTPEATTITPAQPDPTEGFGAFPTITTWEPVDDGGDSDYVRPKTTLANPAHDPFVEAAGAWQPAGQRPVVQPEGADAAERNAFANPFNTIGSGDSTEQPAATSIPAPPVETPVTTASLAAPSWPNEAPPAQDDLPAAPAWPSSDGTAPTTSLPSLPTLDGNPSDNNLGAIGDGISWSQTSANASTSTSEVAPPPPMIVEGAPSAAEPINIGTILALLTVIGLGLVAVLAFRTRPEGA